jgi:hypothetical protein
MRAYARSRRERGLVGGSLQGVQRAVRRGWVRREPDGSILPGPADASWAQLHSPKVFVTHTTTATPAESPRGPLRGKVWAWEPSEAQVRRWTKVRQQLRWIDGRLAHAVTSSHFPQVRPRSRLWLYQLETPDWAYQEPRVYALEMANDLVAAALIELSRAIGYPGYKCPEEVHHT